MLSNVADLVAVSASGRPNHPALIDPTLSDTDRSITYAQLDRDVTSLAAGLLAAGVAPGDRVCLTIGNRIPFAVALYGILRAGAVAVPLNTTSTPLEIEHAVSTTDARILVTDAYRLPAVEQARLGGCVRLVARSAQWDTLLASGGPELIPGATDPESLAVLLFTAGSTGKPKPAMLRHRCLLANIEALRALCDPPAVRPDDRVLAVLPLFHVYGLNAVLTLSLATGATVVLLDRFTAQDSLELIASQQLTVVPGAPPMYVAWSVEPGLREAMAPVRLLTSGSAPLAPAVLDQFRTMTGKPIWEGYGLTECSPVVTTTLASGAPKSGSVGAPLGNVEVRIVQGSRGSVQHKAGHEEDDGETGEIWVRGPSVFAGYWPDGAAGPDEAGWLATGDVGYFDAAGDLHLVNRRFDLILVSGFNVYPREVEEVVNALPGVAECAVTGVPHPHSGEAVKVFVELQAQASVTAEEVVAWCEQRLARYKCPTIVAFVDELPHGATGKIERGRLREL